MIAVVAAIRMVLSHGRAATGRIGKAVSRITARLGDQPALLKSRKTLNPPAWSFLHSPQSITFNSQCRGAERAPLGAPITI